MGHRSGMRICALLVNTAEIVGRKCGEECFDCVDQVEVGAPGRSKPRRRRTCAPCWWPKLLLAGQAVQTQVAGQEVQPECEVPETAELYLNRSRTRIIPPLPSRDTAAKLKTRPGRRWHRKPDQGRHAARMRVYEGRHVGGDQGPIVGSESEFGSCQVKPKPRRMLSTPWCLKTRRSQTYSSDGIRLPRSCGSETMSMCDGNVGQR
jgi:hypothetical protein